MSLLSFVKVRKGEQWCLMAMSKIKLNGENRGRGKGV